MFRRYAPLETVDDDLKGVRIACPAQRYNNKSMENMVLEEKLRLTFVARS